MRPLQQKSPWLVERIDAARPMTVFAFHHAGGSASQFHSWQFRLEPLARVSAIQLPGRGGRFREAFATSLEATAADIASVIGERQSGPFALFGHSMGALLAFEVSRHLAKFGFPQACHLFVAGAAAPKDIANTERLADLPDDDLLQVLQSMNGLPADLSIQDRDLIRAMLPTLRADFRLEENYEYVPGELLNVPITVLAGRVDPVVPSSSMRAWARETLCTTQTHVIEGDHFFVDSNQAAVLTVLRTVLGLDAERKPPAPLSDLHGSSCDCQPLVVRNSLGSSSETIQCLKN